MFGAAPVVDPGKGAVAALDGDRLQLSNDDTVVTVSPLGDVTVRGPASTVARNYCACPLIDEDVQAQILTYLAFSNVVLQRIVPTGCIKRVAVALAIIGEPERWRTRAEQSANPNSMTLPMGGRARLDPVTLEPPACPRTHLRLRGPELSEDFATLLDDGSPDLSTTAGAPR